MITAANARELTATKKASLIQRSPEASSTRNLLDSLGHLWDEPATGDRATYYCGTVNAKGADGKYGGYVPYLAAVFLKSGKIVDAVLVGTNFPRQCMGEA